MDVGRQLRRLAARSEFLHGGSKIHRPLAALGIVCLLAAGCTTDNGEPVAGAPAPADAPPPSSTRNSVALAYGVKGDIYVADRDGSNPVRIADGVPVDGADECGRAEHRAEYAVFGTAWSPDGRYLAYWDWGCPVPEGAWGRVLISDAEGDVISSFPGQAWAISWSPDSTRVAVMDDWATEGGATIGVYGIDGTRQAALPVSEELLPGGDYSPAWSRDGSSILFPNVQAPLDGSAPTPLPEEHNRRFGVYSPDGSRFAYMDPKWSLVVEDADGSDAQKAGGPGEFWEVAWSPSGDRVAFIYADGRRCGRAYPDPRNLCDTELRVRDVTTGTETSLTGVAGSDRLRVIEFSPDGDRILFSRTKDMGSGVSSLWSINTYGSDLRRLVPRIDWADWRP
jgi:Tol biopolymer transport system component